MLLNINKSVTLSHSAGYNPVEGSNQMTEHHYHSAQALLSSEPASSFILLSSPKTEEGPSEGMGRETKKESVRVCNFEKVRHHGTPDKIGREERNDRVEVKRPECGPSTLLLPSAPRKGMVRFDGFAV